jgi:hypothetical protein
MVAQQRVGVSSCAASPLRAFALRAWRTRAAVEESGQKKFFERA